MAPVADLEKPTENSQAAVPIVVGEFSYLTADDVAKALGIARYHIVNAVRKSGLHGRKVGTQYLIDAKDFNDWIRSGNFEKQNYGKSRRTSIE
jgi:excisionase family DNA binding protein